MGVLLYPDGINREPDRLPPPHLVEDLQLKSLCGFMAYNNYFKLSVNELLSLWTDDGSVIAYRQEVLRDLLGNPRLESALEELLDCIDVWESRSVTARRGAAAADAIGGAGLNLGEFSFLDSYLDKIARLSETFSALELNSVGMRALSGQVAQMRSSQRFEAIKKGFSERCGDYALPSRLSLGFNLDKSLRPVNLKLLTIERRATKRRKMALTKNAYTMMTQLLGKTVSEASSAIGMYVKRESMALRAVKQDIVFYLSAAKLCRSWEKQGLPFCFPEIAPAGEKAFCAEGMFDPLLVVNGREGIVTNDVSFASGGELLILTGANQGGKTVFLLSVALTQWLFQLGAAAPCKSARLSPAREIVTVFAPTGASFSNHGLLAEEAGRIASAVDSVSPNSLVLFNEPLNSTSPMENLYISREVVGSFKAAGVRGVWVTHLYELAGDCDRMNRLLPWGGSLGSLRIAVEHSGQTVSSTYKIVRGEPEYNSYASEVLRRKGVSIRGGQG